MTVLEGLAVLSLLVSMLACLYIDVSDGHRWDPVCALPWVGLLVFWAAVAAGLAVYA